MLEMEVLPPIILPGGGRFKTSPGSLSGVLVSIRHQSATSGTEVIRWRFSMNQSGRQNAGNGPTIEGRVPARPDTPFEECYQFVSGKMGYRRGSWANGQFNLSEVQEGDEIAARVVELGVDPSTGEFRPGFFRGVATIVLKLLNIVQPKVAVFGKTDYQQLMIVKHMVRQLALPIEIIGCDTSRAEDGLALSSRNGYLDASERDRARQLFAMLSQVVAAIRSGRRDFSAIEAETMKIMLENQWRPDYIAVRKQADLQLPTPSDRELVVLAAAWMGKTRLIDNIETIS